MSEETADKSREKTSSDGSVDESPDSCHDQFPDDGHDQFPDGKSPQRRSSQTGSDSAVASYCCPFCESATYPTAMLVRIHVSRARDEEHAGRDGMMPEVEPVELDSEGAQVGTSFTLPSRLNLHALGLDDIPADYDGITYDERDRRALLVAAYNANSGLSFTQLEDRVAAHLTQHDIAPLSTRELESRCMQFFRPHRPNTAETTSAGDITRVQTTLRDLTPLQQAILLTFVFDPEAQGSEVAAVVGTVSSYPDQVVAAREELLSRLRSVVAGTTSIERLVSERVPRPDIEELIESEHLSSVDIDLGAALERKAGRPTGTHQTQAATWNSNQRHSTTQTATEGASTGLDTAEDQQWDESETGTPPPNRSVRTCEPTDNDPTHNNSAPRCQQNPPREAREGPAQVSQRATGDARMFESVVQVRDQVAFDLAVLEREMDIADPDPGYARAKATLDQIKGRLDDIITVGTEQR